jgi:hypothetical protein
MEIKDGGDNPGRKLLADELPLTILIAEDNVINQKLLMSILRMLDMSPMLFQTAMKCCR